jgi:hypothetical protein
MTEASGLQAVFDRVLDDFKQHHPLSPEPERAGRHIEQCRTEAWGGLQQQCEHCGYETPSSIPAATAIVPNARAGPNRHGANTSSTRSCR